MIDYGKARAIQEFRFRGSGDDRDRRRRKRQYKPLSELLGALASGLAWIGDSERRGVMSGQHRLLKPPAVR